MEVLWKSRIDVVNALIDRINLSENNVNLTYEEYMCIHKVFSLLDNISIHLISEFSYHNYFRDFLDMWNKLLKFRTLVMYSSVHIDEIMTDFFTLLSDNANNVDTLIEPYES
jgi:hypothetical protein